MEEWEEWRSLISFPPFPDSVRCSLWNPLNRTFYQRKRRESRRLSRNFVNSLPNLWVSAECCLDGADCCPTMDEEEVEAGGGGWGGDRLAELPGSSAGRPHDTAAQRLGVFWGRDARILPLYGLITLGANFAFNEQKYRLYNLVCNARIEEETFRLPLNFNRKRQIRTVEWGAIGAPSDSCPEECVDVSQTGINFPKCRLDPWCQPSNADN